jgi:type IX secretion system substrate protein
MKKGKYGTGLTYKWKKNGAYISGATSINYTATTAGTYKVQVTKSTGCSKVSAGIVVTVPCKAGGSEGESESENESVPIDGGISMNVYPNPTAGEFTIQFADKSAAPIEIELTDMPGKVIERFEVTEQTVLFNKSGLANGIYFLAARNKNGTLVRKIIISK